jgi:Flp pilus assembly protein TadG
MRRLFRDRRGQSAAEALLITVLLVTLTFGGIELARAVALKQALDRGAFEGARYLATRGDVAGAAGLVRNAVSNAILGGDPAAVSIDTTWSAGTTYGDTVCVTASYPVTLDMPLVAVVARTLQATHCTVYEVL